MGNPHPKVEYADALESEIESLRAQMATPNGAIELVNRWIDDDPWELLEDFFRLGAEHLDDDAEAGRRLTSIVRKRLREMAEYRIANR